MASIRIEIDDDVYAVADRLRQSYYENCNKTLAASYHPLQWIRMAEAAIAEVKAQIRADQEEVSAP